MKDLIVLTLCLRLVAAIWPIPLQYESGHGVLWIADDVQFSYGGPTGRKDSPGGGYGAGSMLDSSAVVRTAIRQAHESIFQKNIVPWKFHSRHDRAFEPATDRKQFVRSVVLEQLKPDPKNLFQSQAGDIDESYSLTVEENGNAHIAANSSVGIAHAITSFTQLFYAHSAGGAYTPLVPVKIYDSPRFAHRGLNIDVSRHYFPVKDLQRTIDALALAKFNRLHIHATDSQSWPLCIPSIPDLAGKGAYSSHQTYEPDQLREIQHYGALKAVEVFIEIDTPGHTASIAYSHPNLITAFDKRPKWDDYALEPPSGSLKLNSSDVRDFLDSLYADLLPRLKTYSSYFHTGGDEVSAKAYELDETVNSGDHATIQPFLQQFVSRNHDTVRKAGLTPIVWEEMLLDWDLELGDDVVVQTWRSDEAVQKTVSKGHKTIVGNYNYWYLDCGHGAWLSFSPGDLSRKSFPYADYCSPRKNWKLIYSYDPLSGVSQDQQHLILGGEVHLWAEQTDPSNLDVMLWPRAAAAAEILWSGAKDVHGANRSQIEAAPRLSELRERLVALGINAEPIQMPFCTMEGGCEL